MTTGSAPQVLASEPRRTDHGRRTATRIRGAHPVLFAAPAAVALALFVILPVLLALVTSFFDLQLGASRWTFVGLDNYIEAISSNEAQRAAFNTVIYIAIIVVPSIAIGLGVAVLVDSVTWGKSVLRTLLFLPVTANLVALSVVFSFIFNTRAGVANQLLGFAGVGPIDFTGDPTWALPTVASVMIWRAASFAMVIYLAGLTTIPGIMQDAARADGLGVWSRLRWVTWPLLRPTTVLVTVLTTIGAMQTFEAITVITEGGPVGATENLLFLAWEEGFGNLRLGYASALSVLLLITVIMLGLLRSRWLTRGDS